MTKANKPYDTTPCKDASMQVYASMQVCKYASMQVCKYAGMQVCKYASMHIYACSSMQEVIYQNCANQLKHAM